MSEMDELTMKFTFIFKFSRRKLSFNGAKSVLIATDTYENEKPDGSSAPPVLITHGLLGSKANFTYIGRSLAAKCKPQRKIIAADLRNHGESPNVNEHSYQHLNADFNYLMEVNRFENVSIIGHSMGGRAAMYFSLMHPKRVEKIVVLDVSPVNHTKRSEFSYIKFLLDAMIEVTLPKDITKSKARDDVDAQLATHIKQPVLRQFLLTNLIEKEDGSFAWRVNLPILIENFFYNIRTFPDVAGRTFKGPVLFVIGEESDFVRPKDHGYIKQLFPNVKTIVISGAGHWLHSEKPEEIIKHCVDFFNH